MLSNAISCEFEKHFWHSIMNVHWIATKPKQKCTHSSRSFNSYASWFNLSSSCAIFVLLAGVSLMWISIIRNRIIWRNLRKTNDWAEARDRDKKNAKCERKKQRSKEKQNYKIKRKMLECVHTRPTDLLSSFEEEKIHFKCFLQLLNLANLPWIQKEKK